jgi:hypothetical protein
MNLTVLERIKLLESLPLHGDIGKMRAVRQLREALEPDKFDAEKGLKIIDNGDGTMSFDWGDTDWSRDIELSPVMIAVVVETLRDLNKEEQLTAEHLTLYDKFIGE